jgi:hypothetical protein
MEPPMVEPLNILQSEEGFDAFLSTEKVRWELKDVY